MTKTTGARVAVGGTSVVDVLAGFEPGVYQVIIQVDAGGPGVLLGGDTLTDTNLEGITLNGGAERTIVVSSGELFMVAATASTAYPRILGVPYIGQE
jgi:hypothetical protein